MSVYMGFSEFGLTISRFSGKIRRCHNEFDGPRVRFAASGRYFIGYANDHSLIISAACKTRQFLFNFLIFSRSNVVRVEMFSKGT